MHKSNFLKALLRGGDLILVAGILGTLLVILFPLPPALLDGLLILNLTISLIILVTAALVARPLDFDAFPPLLLVVTFARLALNVATTRLILGNAHERGLAAAGQVVQTFAGFVAGSNLTVGLVVFSVIAVIQFVVITKGTTRISEVAARFTLDAMPGKQLSIDGDLAAGWITDAEARRRRAEVGEEASFYGAMDGASKFVRGEAVAGVFILLVNILGGFFIGTVYHGMDLSRAADVFTRLTVGDGLVTQVPALMVSVATALLVTKGSGRQSLSAGVGRQLFASDRVLFVVAAFLMLLLPTGLPKLGLLAGTALCAGLGFALRRPALAPEGPERAESESIPSGAAADEKARSLLVVEPIELEIGFRLIGLVDEGKGGDLLGRLGVLREKIATELGLVVPPVKVADNTRLHPAEYSIKLRANVVGRWRVRPDRYFVTVDGEPPAEVAGTAGVDPATGKPGVWVDEAGWSAASSSGLRVRKVSEVITDHLNRVIQLRAVEILTREEVSRLINDLRKRAPALVDELIPGTLKIGEVHKVLQGLLREQVSIRDLETILETLADHGDRTRDMLELIEQVRRALSRSICSGLAGRDGVIQAMMLDPALEEFLQSSVEKTDRGTRLALEPEMVETLVDALSSTVERFDSMRRPPVLICSGMVRAHLRGLVAARAPLLSVLAYEEITDGFRLEERGTVALEKVG